jgi:glycosyltransferase involved in cell wall biosynthesis
MVGTDPRKNIEGARQALKMLTTSSSKFKLVVVGRPWRDVSASDVMFLGYVSKEDLAALYSGATALLYVSFYEGFGLPILEAMKLGCPVVTSCVSSMPEVAGDAAVLVDPYNPESIAWGIKQVLFYSQDLIRKGKLRAKEFSWKYTSELMMRVYNKLLR